MDRFDGELYGLVSARQPRLEVGHAQISFLRTSRRRAQGELFEGLFLLIDHLFKCFPFRKLCAELPEFNAARIGIPEGVLEIEGILRAHHYYDGQYWDHYMVAIWRGAWREFAASISEYFSLEET